MSVQVSPYEVRLDRHARAADRANQSSIVVEAVSLSDEMSGSGTVKTATDSYSFRVQPAQRQSATPLMSQRSPAKILRRLDGFLVEDEGEEYKVAFVENGTPIFYYLPSSLLRKAGITAPNQPFQMDELEVELPNGRNATAYSFVPLAKPSESFLDSIDMNEERKRKLSAIFRRFGQPKD
jgi:hypothetical protein